MPSYSGSLQPKQFYAYIHARPDGTPFYVGKGNGRRVRNFSKRNPHHKNIVAKYGKNNILIGSLECSTEAISFELEKGMIKCLRKMGVELTNRTNGGEGCVGLVLSDDAKARISASLRGRKGFAHTPESKAKISMANTGKKRSEEARMKIRQTAIGRVVSNETREKLRAAAYVFWAKRKQMLGEPHAIV
jgi:hypothetical protein